MTNKRKMLTAIAAGFILGVLYAPRKGSKTRRKINEQRKKMTAGMASCFGKGTNAREEQPL